ncbi:hypothetical protein A0H81_08371 [Grifola frondosa]|uniref:Uncharacterized protein n=1 Tax=Grifola frondosa TaxID=5627 RepID=A0A1C7M3T7_GRIFR|nr:hypothetical protein A0H81_08371 [Grifola frondosa]
MSTVDISALASPTNPHAIHTTSVTVSLADAASALVALANPGASTTTLAEPGMAPKTPVPTTSAGAVHVAAPGEPAAGIPASAATQSAPISSAVSPTTAPKVLKVVPAAVNTRSKKQRAKATNVDAKSSWTPGIAITPRNLCARDWLKEHPNGKKTEFEDQFQGSFRSKEEGLRGSCQAHAGTLKHSWRKGILQCIEAGNRELCRLIRIRSLDRCPIGIHLQNSHYQHRILEEYDAERLKSLLEWHGTPDTYVTM